MFWIVFSVAAQAGEADPCLGVSRRELDPDSCPRFHERASGPSGSCCLLQGFKPEELQDAMSPAWQPETAEHVRQALESVVVRNFGGAAGPVQSGRLAITSYNVERGTFWKPLTELLTDCGKFGGAGVPAAARAQICRPQNSDILLLVETDDGVCRTGMRDVPAELASLTRMNYAFAPEFVELSANLRGSCAGVLPDRLNSRHGETILSRFPILRARRIALRECYDWFSSELPSMLGPQIRRGGRIALAADIRLPGGRGTLTAVAVHLENKTGAACREGQIEDILKALQDVKNPIVIGGDFNTLGFNPQERNPLKIKTPETVLKRLAQAGFDTSMNDGKPTMTGYVQGPFIGRIDHLAARTNGRFAPANAETLDSIWIYGGEDVSDHHPVAAELVFKP